MAETILSDELLRQLIAVGQVDVLVAVPTFNNAATAGTVVRAVHRSFATDFLRERTVLINSDAGSGDGTPDVVRGASQRGNETVIAPATLRTIHRISAPYHGLPGKGGALRTLFAAADLLQARAVAVFEADVTSIQPWWVTRLVRPILDGRAEFVAPVFPRHAKDGLLVTQLVRPFLGAAYGCRIREPLASEFACSGRFAAHCLAADVWDSPLAPSGIDLWLTASAVSGGFRCAEAPLGPRVQAPSRERPALPEIVSQVAGSLFACLERHEAFWRSRTGSEAVPSLWPAPEAPEEPPRVDRAAMVEAFRSGVRDLSPVLGEILRPETLGAVSAAAQETEDPRFPDELWVSTVYEVAVAHRRGTLHREHVTQALVPLYLGRAASFLAPDEDGDAARAEQRLEELHAAYERGKPFLVEIWPGPNGR